MMESQSRVSEQRSCYCIECNLDCNHHVWTCEPWLLSDLWNALDRGWAAKLSPLEA